MVLMWNNSCEWIVQNQGYTETLRDFSSFHITMQSFKLIKKIETGMNFL